MTGNMRNHGVESCCISFEHVSRVFIECADPVAALRNVSLDIGYGEFVSIMGTSGSGKTTLLNLAAGLDCPTEGEVWIEGQCIAALGPDQRAIFRRRNIGVVYQSFNLLDILDVKGNITFPLELDGTLPDMEYIEKICGMLGIRHKLGAMPTQLSGGERQRASIARALAVRPAVLLADEPTGNLDVKAGLDVLALLKSMNRELGQTILMVTHNPDAAQFADRIIWIEDGCVVNHISPHGQSYLPPLR